MHLLVIEDERVLCETIVRSLRRLAYSVDHCYDGDKALELLGTERYDLVLLDLNLPGKDGMTVLRTFRQRDRKTPVLILSARSEVKDKVEGLDAGANDYLSKPFHLAELEARIRSLTLRQFTQQDVLLTFKALSFDTRSRTATVNGQTLALTRKETGILEYLMVHQGRPVSQEELMEHVWDNSVDSFSNSIRVHISALRKKLRAVLDRAAARLAVEPPSVVIACEEGNVKLYESELLYAESFLHDLVLHTSGPDYRIRESISAFAGRLSADFFRTHRSYLVNLKAVVRIGRTSVLLRGGAEVPLARGKYDAINRAFIDRN